jgi:asparagine synthase (glutamine-hydrolysing)
VEVRLPFLDHRLVEYALALPAAQKIQAGYTKHVLRTAMNPYLPAAVTWRKDKVGFEPPQRQWMQHPQLHEMIQAARELLVQRGVLDPRVLAQPVQPEAAHAAGNRDWRILSLVKTVFKE